MPPGAPLRYSWFFRLPQCTSVNPTDIYARYHTRYGRHNSEPGHCTCPQGAYSLVGKPENKPAIAVYNEEKPMILRGPGFEGAREERQ